MTVPEANIVQSSAGWCRKGVLHKRHFLGWDYTFLLVEVLQILVRWSTGLKAWRLCQVRNGKWPSISVTCVPATITTAVPAVSGLQGERQRFYKSESCSNKSILMTQQALSLLLQALSIVFKGIFSLDQWTEDTHSSLSGGGVVQMEACMVGSREGWGGGGGRWGNTVGFFFFFPHWPLLVGQELSRKTRQHL